MVAVERRAVLPVEEFEEELQEFEEELGARRSPKKKSKILAETYVASREFY